MMYILRNLWYAWRRFKTAGILNVLGLATAFAAFVMVLIHVNFEYGYDQFHPDKERLYRAELYQEGRGWMSNFPRPLAERFMASSAHVQAAGLWRPSFNIPVYLTVDHAVEESGFREYLDYISPGFAKVVIFDMISGSADALQNPEMVLIPKSLARKFFGNEPAVGRRITFSGTSSVDGTYKSLMGGFYPQTVTVGGVYRDFPANSIFPNHIYGKLNPQEAMTDGHTGVYFCFLKLDSPDSRDLVVSEFIRTHDLGPTTTSDLRMTPVTDVYFNPVRADILPFGSRLMTHLLLAVAFLVVAIASVNYVNFTIALTPFRIKAINTQKVFGCPVGLIRRQLVLESVVIAFTAFLLSLFIVELLNESRLLTNMFASLSLFENRKPVLLSAVLSLLVGLFAGLYPAWYMTSFPTVMVLSGSFALSFKARFIRKALIGFQYVVSLALIIVAIFVHIQNRFVSRVDMGFDKEHILEVELSSEISMLHSERYRQMLLEHPDVRDVAFAQQKFVNDGAKINNGQTYHGEHYFHFVLQVSYNFPEMIGVHAVAGRDFIPGDERRDDGVTSYLFNVSAQKMMGLVPGDSIDGCYIAGIFPDIHFESLHQAIEPMAFAVSPPGHWDMPFPLTYSYIKMHGDNIESVSGHIRKVLHGIDPDFPVGIAFFDKTLEHLYAKDHNQGLMITLLCLLTVLISLVGVFGLVIFETQSRTKEIALRKVMGATVREVLVMFNTGFLRIVLVCFVIALPLSWWSVSAWLDNFSYRTPIYLWVFLVALLLMLLLTVVTVTFQSYRTATANPARSLQK